MSWVVVTGGAKGIGAAICRELALIGYNLVVHYRTSAEGVVQSCRQLGVEAISIRGDLSSQEGVEQFAAEVLELTPEIGGLVNGVGPYLQRPLLETGPEEIAHLFQTNLYAPMELLRLFSDALIAQKGRVVQLGLAGLSPFRDDRRAAAYRIAKLALWGYTRAIAHELAPTGVTVNMVSPGQTETSVDLEEERKKLPMARPATVDEIALSVVHFFRPETAYITGQNIEIAGAYAL